MFALGDKEWPGISKLIEETGEVLQIAGKLIQTRGERKHWNVPDLIEALQNELGDLLAAIDFVTNLCRLDRDAIEAQRTHKRAVFIQWHTGTNRP